MHWRRKWQPTPSVLAWRIPGTGEPGGLPSRVAQSRTRLKRLSSSSRELTRWFSSIHSHKWIKSKNSQGKNGTLGTFQLVCQFFIYLEGSSNLEKVLLLCFSLNVSICLKMSCLHFIFSRTFHLRNLPKV